MGRALGLLLLCGVVLGVYEPSTGHEFIHDDRQLILRQERPGSMLEIAQVFAEPHWPGMPYYRPVTRATMVLQKYLYGDDPAPFHRFNDALMCAAALAFFALLRRRPFEVRFVPALLAAAIFAVHPIASGTVYPICSGRETLVPAVLMLCAVLAWLSPGALAYGAALGLAALSLFAKEQAAVLPGLFVLADLLRLTVAPPGRSPSRWILRYAPIAVLFAVYFAIRSQLFGGALHQLAVFDRPYYPLLTLAYTLQTSLVPFVALVFEPRWPVWWSPVRTALWVVLVTALVHAVVRSGPQRRRQALFLAGWWLLGLLPTANLLVQESPFAERYGFFSLAGLIGIAALKASDAWPRPGLRIGIAAVGAALVASLAAITVERGPHFANEVAFAVEWVRSDPDSYKAQLNRGQGFVETGDWEQAVEHLAIASHLRPRSGTIHNGLGYALWRKGDTQQAAVQFAEAVRLAPRLAVARVNYGDLLVQLGELDAALEQYRHAERLTPRDARTQLQLGRALRLRGDLDLAARHLERAARLDPVSARALLELGELREDQGQPRRAAEHYEEALRRQPGLLPARAALRRVRREGAEPGAGPRPDTSPPDVRVDS